MRRTFYFAALLLIVAMPSLAQYLVGGGGRPHVVAAGCSPVVTGHQFDETFNAGGTYDNAPEATTTTGGTLDPNNVDATPLSSDCVSGEMLFVDQAVASGRVRVTWDYGSTLATAFYTRHYFRLESEALAPSDPTDTNGMFFGLCANAATPPSASCGISLQVAQDAGTQLSLALRIGTGSVLDTCNISVSTWYRIETMSDDDTGWEWWVSDEAGTELCTGSGANDPGGFQDLFFGSWSSNDYEIDFYVDNISISTSARINN